MKVSYVASQALSNRKTLHTPAHLALILPLKIELLWARMVHVAWSEI